MENGTFFLLFPAELFAFDIFRKRKYLLGK
jgi:hypothetical protein